MRSLIHSDFLWRALGGFAIGVVGVVTLSPAGAATLVERVVQVAH